MQRTIINTSSLLSLFFAFMVPWGPFESGKEAIIHPRTYVQVRARVSERRGAIELLQSVSFYYTV